MFSIVFWYTLRPFLVAHIRKNNSYPEEKSFVSVIVYEETCDFS